MPIWKNEKDNVLMVEMGFGDVIVSSAKMEGKSYDDELVISPMDKPGEVNADAPQFNGRKTDEVKSAVRFVFHRRESILAVMHHLQRILDGWPLPPCPDPEAHEKGDLLLPCDHLPEGEPPPPSKPRPTGPDFYDAPGAASGEAGR